MRATAEISFGYFVLWQMMKALDGRHDRWRRGAKWSRIGVARRTGGPLRRYGVPEQLLVLGRNPRAAKLGRGAAVARDA